MIPYYRAGALSSVLTVLLMLIHASAAEVQQGGNKSPANLDDLRKAYRDASARAAEVPRPRLGTREFKDALPTWANLQRERTTAAHRLAEALFKTWTNLPDDSPELLAVQEELKILHQRATEAPFTENTANECSFFAGAVWQLVVPATLSQKRASFLTSLSVPHRGIRVNDTLANRNLPSEPWGWDVQDAYCIALLRAGRVAEARKENELLLKKVKADKGGGRLPALKVNFRGGTRT